MRRALVLVVLALAACGGTDRHPSGTADFCQPCSVYGPDACLIVGGATYRCNPATGGVWAPAGCGGATLTCEGVPLDPCRVAVFCL